VGLITLDQVRAEGLDATVANDARVTTAIETWSGFIEQQCRQPFSPKARTITFDGNNSDTLFLPWPILGLRSLFINGDFVNALGSENYRAYMGVDFPDDRKNPKIRLAGGISGGWQAAYYLGRNRMPFARGKQNQRLVGVFGYCDPGDPIDIAGVTAASPMVVTTATAHGLASGDWIRLDDAAGLTAANYVWRVTVVDATTVSLNGSAGAGAPAYTGGGALRKLTTPALIQRAVMKLVLAKVDPLATSDEAQTPGPAAFEMTDGHSIQYLTADKFKNRALSFGITKDAEVEQIIAMFRAPAKMRAPGTMSFQDEL
jgi:hypothetical protein